MKLSGFTTIRTLAPGGMTDVFLARNKEHDRVVLRRLSPEFARKRKWRKAFLRGATILERLDHPNIIQILDCAVDDGIPYMVLEYVESRTLRSLILAKDQLIADNLLSMMRQMAHALYYVHTMGYLHLDFKPDNLLVNDKARVTLIDFDLAIERRQKLTRYKKVDGTPFYLPPEALLHRRLDERADIYAFGVTAYEMINFHKPFRGDTLDQARAAQTRIAFAAEPLNLKATRLPPALESLILKCLAKDPEDRYPSMSSVLRALDQLV